MLSLKYNVKCDVIAQVSSTTGIRNRSDGYCPRCAEEVLPLDTGGDCPCERGGEGEEGKVPAGGRTSQGGKVPPDGCTSQRGRVPTGGTAGIGAQSELEYAGNIS